MSVSPYLEAGDLPSSTLLTRSPQEQQAGAAMTRDQERLSQGEMEMVMSTFKQYEVSLRGACIDVKDLLPALVSLGLNMMEQEVTDMTNTIARDGLVFFPDFCKVVLNKYREEDQEQFSQIMFKVQIDIDIGHHQYRKKNCRFFQ